MGNEKQTTRKKRDGRTQGVRVSAYVSHLTGVCACVFKFMQFATRFQHTYIHTIERLDSAALLLERACTRERVMQWQQHVCSADAVRRPHGYFIYLRATGNPVTAILNWYIFVILCCSPNRFRACLNPGCAMRQTCARAQHGTAHAAHGHRGRISSVLCHTLMRCVWERLGLLRVHAFTHFKAHV